MKLGIQLSDFEDSDFDVEKDDFGQLEIREIPNGTGFHYFYDTASRRLIKNFRMDNRPRVATLCEVALIRKGELLTPRIRFWKRDKSATALRKATASEVIVTDASWTVKTSVDTTECHLAFWTLVSYLQSCSEIDFPASEFRVSPRDEAELARSLQRFDRLAVLSAVQSYLGGPLSTADVNLLLGRREQLEYFERLLTDDDFFGDEIARREVHGSEGLWQRFFEENSWIFGYGLTLLAYEAVSQEKLEQITTGASLFSGAGKRSDAVLRTRGFISSLLFAEIKSHNTPLLRDKPYRPPDVYQVSEDVSGGLSQVQKTAHKAVHYLSDLYNAYSPEGEPRFEVATLRPRQILIVGNLGQMESSGGVNVEKLSSFELYRRAHTDVEIITFDELYERARFIVQD